MRGLSQDLAGGEPHTPYITPVIAVVAAQNFPPTQLSDSLSEGLRTAPLNSLWVCRASNRGAEKLIREMLPDPIVLTPNEYFKYTYERGGNTRQIDDRAAVRDYEIILCCSKVVVFHLPGSTTSRFAAAAQYHPHIFLVEAT